MGRGASIARVALQSALAGALYGAAFGGPLLSAGLGAAMGGILAFMEFAVYRRWLRASVMRLPFIAYFTLRVAIYFVVILGVRLAVLSALGYGGDTLNGRDLAFTLFACIALNLLFSVNELLGPGVLFAFAAGRYRRPRREERLLLYVDLCGSTGLAERLGEARFLDLLNAFFADATAEIVAQGGEIHKYVGDEVIATWRGDADPMRPIRATLAARERLRERGAFYRAAFGEIPAFRAAIHAGAVVIGELGAQKKEIALIGDAMNTAARILDAARETGASVLISAPTFERIGKAELGARRMPAIALRGKSAPLPLFSISPEYRDLQAAERPI